MIPNILCTINNVTTNIGILIANNKPLASTDLSSPSFSNSCKELMRALKF
jgi:hypothetical protein